MYDLLLCDVGYVTSCVGAVEEAKWHLNIIQRVTPNFKRQVPTVGYVPQELISFCPTPNNVSDILL